MRQLRACVVPRRLPAARSAARSGGAPAPCLRGPAGRRCFPLPRTAPPAAHPGAARRAGARTVAHGRRSSEMSPSRRPRRPARSSSSSSRSPTRTSTRPSQNGECANRSLAAAVIDGEASSAITRAPRQALEQRFRNAPRAAPRVQHRLIARRARAGAAPRGPAPAAARRSGHSSCRPICGSLTYICTLSRMRPLLATHRAGPPAGGLRWAAARRSATTGLER